jgi:hypothetical protein
VENILTLWQFAQENWLAFIGWMGIPTVVATAAASCLAKLFHQGAWEKYKASLKSEYDSKLEKLKIELKSSSDLELERNKNSLAIQAARSNFQFQKLHDARAETITDSYAALAKTYIALKHYIRPFEPAGIDSKEARRNSLFEAGRNLSSIIDERKIFLPKKIADALDEILQEISTQTNDFMYSVEFGSDTAKWREISQKVDGPIKKSLSELEDLLREILGDAH